MRQRSNECVSRGETVARKALTYDEAFGSGITVVIPFYGDPNPTIELIEALHSQVGAPKLQIIVADDHSPNPFPEGNGYEVVRRESNGGFGSNVNSGMARAEHRYALILNSDLEIDSHLVDHWCRASLPWLPAVTAPAMATESGMLAHVARRFHTPSHMVVEWLRPLARFHGSDVLARGIGHDVHAHKSANPIVTDWLVGAALLVPVAEFRKIGGFDEQYFMNVEEVDLQRRLRDAGVPAVYLPEVRLTHFGAGSSDSDKRLGWVVDSRYKYFAKWGGRKFLHVGLLGATGINFLWNSVRFLRGRGENPRTILRREHSALKHGWKESA